MTPGFIAKWKKEFISAGIEGIILKYKGSRPYLNAEEKQELIQWIINQSHWDIWEIETYVLETYEVVFKLRQSYYQLLKEARISWQNAEQVNPKKDAEEVKKKVRIQVPQTHSQRGFYNLKTRQTNRFILNKHEN